MSDLLHFVAMHVFDKCRMRRRHWFACVVYIVILRELAG